MVKSAAAWFQNRISLGTFSATVLLLLVAFLTLFPVAMVIYASFNSGSPMFPGEVTLKGYASLLTSPTTANASVLA